jgi:uncharacterized repeat protein (TIGR02543 family)
MDGANELSRQDILHGGTAIRPDAPGKPGYIFDDWYADSSFTTLFDFATEITSSRSVYAKYNRDDSLVYAAVEAAETAAEDLAGDGTDTQADIDAAQGKIDDARVLVRALPDDVAPDETKADLLQRLDDAEALVDAAQIAKNATDAAASDALDAIRDARDLFGLFETIDDEHGLLTDEIEAFRKAIDDAMSAYGEAETKDEFEEVKDDLLEAQQEFIDAIKALLDKVVAEADAIDLGGLNKDDYYGPSWTYSGYEGALEEFSEALTAAKSPIIEPQDMYDAAVELILAQKALESAIDELVRNDYLDELFFWIIFAGLLEKDHFDEDLWMAFEDAVREVEKLYERYARNENILRSEAESAMAQIHDAAEGLDLLGSFSMFLLSR